MLVLIAPLDWGLGHATRCVPIIRALLAAGHEVVPCAGGAGLEFLRAEFPHLEIHAIPSHAMRYTRRRWLLPAWLALQLPLFLWSIWRDRRTASALARRYRPGLVVSDGRYGFRVRGIPSVFVSHQLSILPPGPAIVRRLLRRPLELLNRLALRRYDEVWVPDFSGPLNLSGSLGHPASPWPKARYIHPLCRFRPGGVESREPPVDILALVSGPEPQRTLLEEILRRKLADSPGTRVLVRGRPGPDPSGAVVAGSLNVFDHLPEERLAALIAGSRAVVCRSGYTTLMELAVLGKRTVLLIPTPGQPEQEYLAAHARSVGLAAWQDQDALDLEEGFREAAALPGYPSVSAAADAAFDLPDWIRRHPLLGS